MAFQSLAYKTSNPCPAKVLRSFFWRSVSLNMQPIQGVTMNFFFLTQPMCNLQGTWKSTLYKLIRIILHRICLIQPTHWCLIHYTSIVFFVLFCWCFLQLNRALIWFCAVLCLFMLGWTIGVDNLSLREFLKMHDWLSGSVSNQLRSYVLFTECMISLQSYSDQKCMWLVAATYLWKKNQFRSK